MRKGQRTRQRILDQTAELFNQQGYAGASMSDIMRATGLKKGGIYNHFASKDDLALAAFDEAWGRVKARFRRGLQGKKNTVDRLYALLQLFRCYADDPPLRGGCPAMNTTVEADDTHPALLAKAREAVDGWREFVTITVAKGQDRDEIRADVDGEALATLLVAALEGGLLLARLYDDPIHLHRVVTHLEHYIDDHVRAKGETA